MKIILDMFIAVLIVACVSGRPKDFWIALGLVGFTYYVFFQRHGLIIWDLFFPDILFELIGKAVSGIIELLSKRFAGLGSLALGMLKSAASVMDLVLKRVFGLLLKSLFGVCVAFGIFGALKR